MNNVVLIAAANSVVSSLATSKVISFEKDAWSGRSYPVFCEGNYLNDNTVRSLPREDELVEYLNEYGNIRRRRRRIECRTTL